MCYYKEKADRKYINLVETSANLLVRLGSEGIEQLLLALPEEEFKQVVYSYLHSETLFQKAPESLGQLLSFHDYDKIFAIFAGLSAEEASTLHRKNVSHHYNGEVQNALVRFEMALDYEVARLTKPDKPLNALETYQKYHPELIQRDETLLRAVQLHHRSPITKEQYADIVEHMDFYSMASDIHEIASQWDKLW